MFQLLFLGSNFFLRGCSAGMASPRCPFASPWSSSSSIAGETAMVSELKIFVDGRQCSFSSAENRVKCGLIKRERGKLSPEKEVVNMGAPKHKWTPEEEEALMAGVLEHGIGKWRSILGNPEYSSVLHSRSNVDLKDKWRNISVAATCGSRKKAKQGDDGGQQIVPASAPLAFSYEPPQDLFTSVDNMILEAITNFKGPLGPDRNSILLSAEVNANMPMYMEPLVTSRLEHLINTETIIKREHRYSVSQGYAAAKAIAEAELALAEAELAAREADNAEAKAEAARIFAKVAMKALKATR